MSGGASPCCCPGHGWLRSFCPHLCVDAFGSTMCRSIVEVTGTSGVIPRVVECLGLMPSPPPPLAGHLWGWCRGVLPLRTSVIWLYATTSREVLYRYRRCGVAALPLCGRFAPAAPLPQRPPGWQGGLVVRFSLRPSCARHSEVLVADAMAPCQDGRSRVRSTTVRPLATSPIQGSDRVPGPSQRMPPLSHRLT